MTGNCLKGSLALTDLDGLTGLDCAIAVTVANDLCAAALDELGEVGVVVLGAGQNDLAAERPLLVGLAGLKLLQGLLQVRENKVLRANQRYQLNDMELIAGDGGII